MTVRRPTRRRRFATSSIFRRRWRRSRRSSASPRSLRRHSRPQPDPAAAGVRIRRHIDVRRRQTDAISRRRRSAACSTRVNALDCAIAVASCAAISVRRHVDLVGAEQGRAGRRRCCGRHAAASAVCVACSSAAGAAARDDAGAKRAAGGQIRGRCRGAARLADGSALAGSTAAAGGANVYFTLQAFCRVRGVVELQSRSRRARESRRAAVAVASPSASSRLVKYNWPRFV